MLSKVFRTHLKHIKPLGTAMQVLKFGLNRFFERAWLLEGVERNSGEALTVLFAGHPGSRNYIAQVIFGESWREARNLRIWKHRLFQRAGNTTIGHDLAVLHLAERGAPVEHTASKMFRLPCWVGGEKDLETAEDIARRSKHIKSDIRRIRKNRLSYRVTREPAEFDRFYHTMYLPHIQRVFGDHAFLMTYEAMQAAIPDCELFLITQDGQDIAGGILVYDGSDRVRGWSLGVKDGNDQWVRAGALAAFEQLQADYLHDRGFKTLHRGASRPFLKDGALCFKKNRGMVITDTSPQSINLLLRRDGPAVRAFLHNNPFIYAQGDELRGAVFVTRRPDGKTAARLHHDLYVPGLADLRVFCLDEEGGRELYFRACGYIDSSGKLIPATE
jgi:hypothetical protein